MNLFENTILSKYPFYSENYYSCMPFVITFYSFNWFATNSVDARLLNQQLLFSLCWYFAVSVLGWKYFCLFLAYPTGTEKYSIFCVWMPLNIRLKYTLVKFWFSGIEISINPIEVKVKPIFIVNKFPFKFIHIFWSIRFPLCLFNFLVSDIFTC